MSLALLPLVLLAAAPAPDACSAPLNGVPVVAEERLDDVTVAHAMDTFLSARFGDALARTTGMRSREVLRDEVLADGTHHRRVRVRLPVSAAFLAFASEDDLYYDEVTVFDPRAREVRFFVVTVACEQVKYGGTIRFVQDGNDVKLHVDALLDVDAPVVGGLIEALALGGIRDGYDKLGGVLQRAL